MKIGPNRDINKDRKKLAVAKQDVPNTVIPAAPHGPAGTFPHNLKMFTKKHNDDKLVITLLIVGTGLITYHFWRKINGIIIIHSRWCHSECISL